MLIHVVAPTFRESALVGAFLQSWENTGRGDLRVHVVNGDPGDETSDLLAEWRGRVRVEEIEGSPAHYWAGLCRLGLERIAESAADGDLFVLTNIDVSFEGDPVGTILGAADGATGLADKQVALPVRGSRGKLLSAGVEVLSWPLSRNRHLCDGLSPEKLPEQAWFDCTYLPTRFLLAPVRALREGHFPDAERLPHYCADYEYTNRLRRAGYRPQVFTGATVIVSEENTGFDTYRRPTHLWSRLKGIADIKCPYHLGYRWRFVRLAYPGWAQVPGMVTHFAKIFLEIVFGGKKLERWREN